MRHGRSVIVVCALWPLACNVLVGTPDPELRGPSSSFSSDSGRGPLDANPPFDASDASVASDATDAAPHTAELLTEEPLGAPWYITAERAAGGFLFWTTPSGQVVRWDKSTHVRVVLYTPRPPSEEVAHDLTLLGDHVYWTGTKDGEGSVRWMYKDGSLSRIATRDANDGGIGTPMPIAADEWSVYWGTKGDIWRMDINAHPVVLGGMAAKGMPIAVTSPKDGYIVYSSGAFIYRMDKTGKNHAPIGGDISPPGSPPIGPVAIDGSYVYWTEGEIRGLQRRRYTKECEEPCMQTLATGPSLRNVNRLVFDETYVYWLDHDAGRVMRARKDGPSGTPDVLAQHADLGDIAVDDVAVYFTVTDTGSVWRVLK